MADTTFGGTIAAPTDFYTFTLKGGDIKVPTLTLFHIDVLKPEIDKLGPDLDWVEYSKTVIHIVAQVLGESEEWEINVRKGCSIPDMRSMVTRMNEWLEASGFEFGPLATAQSTEAGSPGTGTQQSSPPNSQPTASAPETSTGSSEVIH